MKSLFLSIVYCLLVTTGFCKGSQGDSKKKAWSYSYPLITALGLRNKTSDQTEKQITKSDSNEWTDIEKDGKESTIIIKCDSPTESSNSQSPLKKVPSSQNLESGKLSTPTTHRPLEPNRKSYDKLIATGQKDSMVSSGVIDKEPLQIDRMQTDQDAAAKKSNQEEVFISISLFKLFYGNCCNCFETGAELKKKVIHNKFY